MKTQHSGNISYLQFDLFQRFPEVIHGVFTRQGGCSPAPFASLNTSRGGGNDSQENIAHNRYSTLTTLNLEETPAITLWQVHGADVITYSSHDEWRTDWAYPSYFERKWSPESIRRGDALITREHSTVLTLSFADCVPIVFYDPVQRVIGMAHGGWRGTARGVVLTTIAAMQARFGCQPGDIHVGIGPAIGACCYEVSEQVRQIFLGEENFPEMPVEERWRETIRASAIFTELPLAERVSLRLDLAATNRQQLLLAGVPAEQIEVMQICTSCNTDLFFSHRAEHGVTGRFAVVIALTPELQIGSNKPEKLI